MRKRNTTSILLLAFLAGIAGAYVKDSVLSHKASEAPIVAKESAYDRVLQKNELRCGYSVYPPYFIKDPTTGALSGIWHDLAEVMADHLGVKIVWAEEIGLGDMGIALDSNRIDMYCGGVWTAGKRLRSVDFLKPSAFEPILAYVRADDHRFDNDLSLLNNSNVTVSVIDGEGGALTAAEEFPKAKTASLPQTANYADMFMQVIAHKAVFLLSAQSGAAVFLKSNPGTLRPIMKPIRLYAASFVVKYGEDKLRDLLNQAQDDVIYNGEMEKILSRYEVNKGDFWRVAVPYAPPQ